MVQTFAGYMASAVIIEAGTFSPMKEADPMSLLFVWMAPAAVALKPVPRPSSTDPNVTFGLPESCCVSAAGRIETTGVQAAPPGSIDIVARLLTKPPNCTTTGMKHQVTPAVTVKTLAATTAH